MKKFIFGLLAGISAGILFAPKSGRKFRDELRASDTKFSAFGQALADAAKSAGDEVRTLIESDDVQKLLASGKDSAGKLWTVLQQRGSELSEQAKGQLNEVMNTAMQKTDQIKSRAKAKTDEVTDKTGAKDKKRG